MKKLCMGVVLVSALALMFVGCDTDGDTTGGSTLQYSTDVKVEGATLVHEGPKLLGTNDFGGNQGTNNDDGSYTFNGTADPWSGGGARYTFPTPKSGDTWKLTDYNQAELFFKVTDGTVATRSKKHGGNVDLLPYGGATNSNDISFNSTSTPSFSTKFIIGEAGASVGFQRNNGGPATVAIEKVVFSKVDEFTISFSGGEYTAMPALDPIKIPTGRTVNLGTSYVLPTPTWAGHTLTGWNNGASAFIVTTPITADITLTAQWVEGVPVVESFTLDLDPANWPNPLPANAALTGGSTSYTIPANYATATFDDGVLTLAFDGLNRQRAIIPLSQEQVNKLLALNKQITYRIDGEATWDPDDPNMNEYFDGEFRFHLADPTATSSWNGTATDVNGGPFADLKVRVLSFETTITAAKLGYFVIQAMYDDEEDSNNGAATGYPLVTLTIRSITIDLDNTNL